MMPAYSGRLQRLDRSGLPVHGGASGIVFDDETLTLTPAGDALAFDLGDIDEFVSGDCDLTLKLYTGDALVLSHLGKAFHNVRTELEEAHRNRLVQCLLLEDLEELLRVEGCIQLESPDRELSRLAQLRLFKSNLAILPAGTTGFQWRLAKIDAIEFDDSSYAYQIRSGADRLTISRLGKKTTEFGQRLRESCRFIAERSAQLVHDLFPFLRPEQFQQIARMLKEGRVESVVRLNAVHPQIGEALIRRTVDPSLAAYFDILKARSSPDGVFAGFKIIRKEPDDDPRDDRGDTESESASPECADEVLHWFFFPLRSSSESRPAFVAWEACSKSGRATYVFRLDPGPEGTDAVEAAIRRLNEAIVALNFRREPIYLPDTALQNDRRFRRHAIAVRRMSALRGLRNSFAGRAIHTSPEAWEQKLRTFL
jgi:hypothetical protein